MHCKGAVILATTEMYRLMPSAPKQTTSFLPILAKSAFIKKSVCRTKTTRMIATPIKIIMTLLT
jgi:hypothetical protein